MVLHTLREKMYNAALYRRRTRWERAEANENSKKETEKKENALLVHLAMVSGREWWGNLGKMGK